MKETKEQLALWYYKKHVEGVPLTQDEVIESYLAGFNSAEKRNEVNLKDSLNKYNSQLQEVKQQKLDRVIDQEKIKELEIKVQTLKELIRQKKKQQKIMHTIGLTYMKQTITKL